MIEVVPIRVIRRRTFEALNEAFCKDQNGGKLQLDSNQIEELADLVVAKLQEILESASGIESLSEYIEKLNEEHRSFKNDSFNRERGCNPCLTQATDAACRNDYFDMYGDYDLPLAAFLFHNRIVKLNELLNSGYEIIVLNAVEMAIGLYFGSSDLTIAIVNCFSAILIDALLFIKRSEVLGSDCTCLAYAVKRASMPSVFLPLPKEGKPVTVGAILHELPCISTLSGHACTRYLKHSPRVCSHRIDRRCNLVDSGEKERVAELFNELTSSGLIDSRKSEGGEVLYVYLVY